MYKKRIQVGGGVNGGGLCNMIHADLISSENRNMGWVGSRTRRKWVVPTGVNITFDEYISDEEDANILKITKSRPEEY